MYRPHRHRPNDATGHRRAVAPAMQGLPVHVVRWSGQPHRPRQVTEPPDLLWPQLIANHARLVESLGRDDEGVIVHHSIDFLDRQRAAWDSSATAGRPIRASAGRAGLVGPSASRSEEEAGVVRAQVRASATSARRRQVGLDSVGAHRLDKA